VLLVRDETSQSAILLGDSTMAAATTFTELISWQKARVWSKDIFERTEQKRFSGDRRLVEQVNDSSNSVMANIAEGFGRGTQGEFVLFLGYSMGSLNETQSHLCTAYDRRYITKDEFSKLFQQGIEY
jgi:four helix bundle protein